jgi:hypothetical protein
MVFERIRTASKLKSILERIVAEEVETFEKLCAARAEGTLVHFMSFNSCDYHVAVVRAAKAKRYIQFIDEERDDESAGSLMTDEKKLEIITDEVRKHVLGLNTRIVGRSTSMNKNLEEDAERMFWIEMFQTLNGGY